MIPGVSAEEASGRGKVYGVLALAFYPPGANSEHVWKDMTRLLEALHPGEVTHGKEVTFSALGFRNLEHEYNRLFVGPGHVACPPYESVYLGDGHGGEKGLVLGPSSVDVRTAYREAGLGLDKGFTDLPDHIAVELEFMKYLCDRESDESVKGEPAWGSRQAKFIRSHLGRWTPPFADSVTKNTTSPFYLTAARLLTEFVAEEAGNLPPEAGK